MCCLWSRSDLIEENLRLVYGDLSPELNDTRGWTVDIFVEQGDATREMHGKCRPKAITTADSSLERFGAPLRSCE
jgi:hypothetical protein